MRFRLGIRSLGLVGLLVPLALIAASCSGSSYSSNSPTDSEGGPIDPGTSPEGGSNDGSSGGGDTGIDAPHNDCLLAELAGVADVVPTFTTYEPPTTAPPAMTGGTLSGKYTVDKARVFLPTQTKGLADPTKSMGTVNAWAVFDGKDYRLYLKATFTISSVLGPQMQTADVVSQGAFMVAASALTIDHACDKAPPTTVADYTFTDDGSGRATILIKTPSMYGDTYLQLDASKKP